MSSAAQPGLVLDTTAVAAYVAGSMHVHEPLLVAVEAGDRAAVPVACLIEAVRRDPDIELRDLLHHRQIVVATPDWADEDLLLDWTLHHDGREDLAAAAVLSYRHGHGVVLTGEPDAYAIGGRRPRWVVPIDGSW